MTRLVWTRAACLGAMLLAAPLGAEAKTLRFAAQGDLKSLDPYSLSESFTLSLLQSSYEGLVRRKPDLSMEGALAERWELVDPLRWRFHLRKGVKFHNGEDFTADDVLFSAERVQADGSDYKYRIPKGAKFEKKDDFTVDVVLESPEPLLPNQWGGWVIMSKKWAEANNAVKPTPTSATTPSYASLHENGTGPFIIESHTPGVKTVFKPNPNWWDKPQHNLTEVVFTPIAQDATRVAALLSGEVDWMTPVPQQDIERVGKSPNAQVLEGPDLRTIYLGFDLWRDELKDSSVKGKNPLKDVRVRKAFYQAIDIETIKSKAMRNAATPTALLISPLLFKGSGDFKRFPYDPEASRKLLAEAGYPDGFSLVFDCPNDRYINDERICQAVTGMLARVGIKATLNVQPKAKYFAKILATGGYDTSFYLLGWSPTVMDSIDLFQNILGCRDAKGNGGTANVGGYCSEKLQALAKQIRVETDFAKRDELIKQAWQTAMVDDIAVLPLHQQALAWGVSKKLKVVQPPDDDIVFARTRFVD